MNKLIGLFIASFLAVQTLYSQDIDSVEVNVVDIEQENEIELAWIPTYKEALRKSKKENKPVLIYFTGSDWCGPCKVLDKELFHTEKFQILSDSDLVLLEVDIPRNRDLVNPKKLKENLSLQKIYKIKAFPTLLMVNHRGKKIGEKRGYIMTEYYYPFFDSIIRNSK